MPLSLGSKNKDATATDDDPDEIEQRLRNRLADLEGRLEDQQKVRQMREHIQHMRNKHQLELEKAELQADQRIEKVKAKARSAISDAKKKAKRERKRYHALQAAIEELAEAIDQADETRQALSGAGLDSR